MQSALSSPVTQRAGIASTKSRTCRVLSIATSPIRPGLATSSTHLLPRTLKNARHFATIPDSSSQDEKDKTEALLKALLVKLNQESRSPSMDAALTALMGLVMGELAPLSICARSYIVHDVASARMPANNSCARPAAKSCATLAVMAPKMPTQITNWMRISSQPFEISWWSRF